MTRSVRRLLTLATCCLLAASVAIGVAGPAAADTPEGWPAKPPVNDLHAILLLGGVPVLIFVVLAIMIYGPPLARGESITPGGSTPESQWLGGPRKAPQELAAPDAEDSNAGGAGGTW